MAKKIICPTVASSRTTNHSRVSSTFQDSNSEKINKAVYISRYVFNNY